MNAIRYTLTASPSLRRWRLECPDLGLVIDGAGDANDVPALLRRLACAMEPKTNLPPVYQALADQVEAESARQKRARLVTIPDVAVGE